MSIKVIVVGRYKSGKTCMVNRIQTDRFYFDNKVTYVTVTSYKFKEKEFQFNDIIGKETFQNAVKPIFRNAKIAIIVFSINSNQSFQEVDQWYDRIKELLNVDDPSDSNFVSIILVGSKSDLEEREVSVDQAIRKANSLGNSVRYIEISSKSGSNINELKEELVNCANRITNSLPNSLAQNNQQTSKSGCCS